MSPDTTRLSRGREQRGQTAHDFAIGVSIVLLVFIGVLVLVQGSIFSAYTEPVSGSHESAADRIATFLVEEFSTADDENVLRYNTSASTVGVDEFLDPSGPSDMETLKRRAGVYVSSDNRLSPSVNVTIVNGSQLNRSSLTPATRGNGDKLTWGAEYNEQAGAVSAVRVIQLHNDRANNCTPVCWLVVRVW